MQAIPHVARSSGQLGDALSQHARAYTLGAESVSG